MTVLDYIEKAKVAANCAREFSLEARELVQEMYPDFEQPGKNPPFIVFLGLRLI